MNKLRPLNEKALEAAWLAYDNACPGEHWRKKDRMAAGIRAYLTASDAEREPVAWLAYFAGCGSVNSQTFTSHRKYDAQAWEKQGAEVTPLYADPLPLTDLEAENARLRERLAEALKALEPLPVPAEWTLDDDMVSVRVGDLRAARRVREGGKVDG